VPEHAESTAAALATLDRFMAALNRRDEAGVNDAFNFPTCAWPAAASTWERAGSYRVEDFLARVGEGWHESRWDERTVIHAIGSWGGQRPSMEGYVTGTGATRGATAAGG
jgi:hypothetical protein